MMLWCQRSKIRTIMYTIITRTYSHTLQSLLLQAKTTIQVLVVCGGPPRHTEATYKTIELHE